VRLAVDDDLELRALLHVNSPFRRS
jgi:hypothetical protein